MVADVRADLANSVAADSQGNYFLGVAGQPLLVDPYDGFIIKTDSAGNFGEMFLDCRRTNNNTFVVLIPCLV